MVPNSSSRGPGSSAHTWGELPASISVPPTDTDGDWDRSLGSRGPYSWLERETIASGASIRLLLAGCAPFEEASSRMDGRPGSLSCAARSGALGVVRGSDSTSLLMPSRTMLSRSLDALSLWPPMERICNLYALLVPVLPGARMSGSPTKTTGASHSAVCAWTLPVAFDL